MSTKSSIFLTKDNEHCYYEHTMPHYNEKGEWIGDTIFLEMDKKNIRVYHNDDDDFIVSIDPGSELYDLIKKMRD